MSESKIPISVVNGSGYVWTVEHVAQLREQHRICGLLLGTLPQVAQQNIFLGLPMQLLPEEVVLLVSKSLAYLIDDGAAHLPAATLQQEQWLAERAADFVSQQEESLARAEEKRLKVQEIYAGQIEKRRLAKAQKKAQSTAANVNLLTPEAETIQAVHVPAHTIKIAGASADLSWYDPSQSTYHDLETAKQAGLWHYPSTLLQRAKCAVFEDLWSKGNYMGGGLKFGGDLLVYPGDPLRFHSHFSTTILASPLANINPLDLVAYGRLATGVKKSHLLCSYDERSGEVSYLSLEWAAMG